MTSDKPAPLGEVLFQEFIQSRGLAIADVAKQLRVSKLWLLSFIRGRVSATEEVAERIAVWTGTSIDRWTEPN